MGVGVRDSVPQARSGGIGWGEQQVAPDSHCGAGGSERACATCVQQGQHSVVRRQCPSLAGSAPVWGPHSCPTHKAKAKPLMGLGLVVDAGPALTAASPDTCSQLRLLSLGMPG